MTSAFFTIGHSNRSFDAFARLLRDAQIERLVDVRAFPRSRTNPQFNIDTLPDALASMGIAYEHLASLGGRRGRSDPVPAETNGFWTNRSFHNYADHALSADFQAGLDHLIVAGQTQRCAIMCSEAVWWRCHRRIVADYLIAEGEIVFHIMGGGRLERAQLTTGAMVEADATIIYPAPRNSPAAEQP